jgi:hypothetical protein
MSMLARSSGNTPSEDEQSNAVRRSDTPSLPPASPAEEINASRHDIVALDTRGRALREPPRRRALKFSRPRPVRPARPSRHAAHAVATRAACVVAKASASQAVATHAALLHRSRAVPSHAQMKHGDPHPFQGAVGIVARTPGFAVALGARDPRLTPGNCRWSLGSAELQELWRSPRGAPIQRSMGAIGLCARRRDSTGAHHATRRSRVTTYSCPG